MAAVIAAWAIAQYPTLLPSLTVSQAAAPHDALATLVVAVLAGGIILFPSLGLLFRLTLSGRLRTRVPRRPQESAGARAAAAPPPDGGPCRRGLPVAGIGLLTIADAPWTHALGVLSLFGFMISAFLTIVPAALARDG